MKTSWQAQESNNRKKKKGGIIISHSPENQSYNVGLANAQISYVRLSSEGLKNEKNWTQKSCKHIFSLKNRITFLDLWNISID